MPRVFVSHASADREVVEETIIAPLNDHGCETWYSNDAITTANEWQQSILKALDWCEWFLVALSPSAADSNWVKAEVSWALEKRRGRVVPVLLRDCEPEACNLQLRLIQYVNFIDGSDDIQKLVQLFRDEGDDLEPTDSECTTHGHLIDTLRGIRQNREIGKLPIVFECLAHVEESVRVRAQQAFHAIGWDAILDALTPLAYRGNREELDHVLTGLAALQAHREVIAALDRLVAALTGELRNRAILLADRKRLSLEFETIRDLFSANHSPYEIQKVLGQGLFAASFLARHRQGNLKVVVRVLRREFAIQPRFRADFMNVMARSMQYVDGNLVVTRDMGQLPEDNIYYSVRDYIEGVPLQAALHSSAMLGREQSLEIVRQIASALRPIHQRREIHGAIKPANIFLCEDDHVVLGDPGLNPATVGFGMDRLSYDLRYVAPECFAKDVSPASDFYALGCVAYELLRGVPVAVSDNPFELAQLHRDGVLAQCDLDEELQPGEVEFLRRMLSRDPLERPRSIDEVYQLLQIAHSTQKSVLTDEQERLDLLARRWGESVYSICDVGNPGDKYGTMYEAPSSPSDTTDGSLAPSQVPGDAWSQELPKTIGNYVIIDVIGRGGMGVVYKAQHEALARLVAIKMILAGKYADETTIMRFVGEARAVAAFHHPDIVQIFDVGRHDNLPYMVLEYVPGGSLRDRLRDGPLALQDAAALVERLARAIHAAHQAGVIHRDLKPANVLFTEKNEPKITDFGLARRLETEDPHMTDSGMILGTPAYMAPEQASGDVHRIGPTTDVYGLGSILYECLTGRLPFVANVPMETVMQIMHNEPVPLRQQNKNVPMDLETICLKCLAKDPHKRYATAQELAEDLRRWQDDTPITARPVGWLERTMRRMLKHRTVTVLTIATMVLLGLVATLIGVLLSR